MLSPKFSQRQCICDGNNFVTHRIHVECVDRHAWTLRDHACEHGCSKGRGCGKVWLVNGFIKGTFLDFGLTCILVGHRYCRPIVVFDICDVVVVVKAIFFTEVIFRKLFLKLKNTFYLLTHGGYAEMDIIKNRIRRHIFKTLAKGIYPHMY